MKNIRNLVSGRFLLSAILLAGLFLSCLGGFQAGEVRAEGEEPPATPEAGEYVSRSSFTAPDGQQVERIIIHGPPDPPAGVMRTTTSFASAEQAAGVVILPVPAYDWFFGCSATSAAMIAAYHDRNGYPNLYTGPTNGGVMPLTSSVWGFWKDGGGDTYNQCPLTASRNGLDGRSTRGSIDDYWVEYYSSATDPFITNSWTEHTYGTAVGDYMRTSQSTYSNVDGSTSFYEYTTSTILTCDTLISWGVADDGSVGRRLFYQARGYTVTTCYNQKTDNYASGGFSFAQYKAEIDAGRPVFLNLSGHSIVGIGYDSATQTVYLNDTWDYSTHTMPWGGSYAGMPLMGVSMVTLAPSTGYTLNVSKGGAGSGTVTSNPAGISCGSDCSETYDGGTSVTLTAAPAAGSVFTGWSGDCSGTGACTLTMDAPRSVTATFSLGSATLTVVKAGTGGGTVSSSPAGISCGTDCTETYPAGTVVTLTASPRWHSTFTGWSGACTGTGTCTLTMDAVKEVTAIFTYKNFDLTVSLSGTGSGTVTSSPAGISCGVDCFEAYPYNTVVTLSAAPAAGSTFTGWSGACTGTGTCTVTMTAAKSVTASFTLLTYTLDVSKAGTGSGTVTSSPSGISCGSDCSETYNYNTTVTLAATAAAGSTFAGWSGACTGTGTCTVTMTAARNVTATFMMDLYDLSVSKNGTGSGTVTSSPVGISCGADCIEAYPYNTTVTLSAAPAAGSVFAGWSGACTGTGTCTLTMTAARTVTATFNTGAQGPYLLTVTKIGSGKGSVGSSPAGIYCGTDCSESYAAGTVVTLSAYPKYGYVFSGWGGACSGTGTCTLTMDAAKAVTAAFEPSAGSYLLSVSRDGSGSGTVTSSPAGISCGSDCSETYDGGTSVTLTASPAAGSTFAGWSGACTGTGTCMVTMSAARSVTATFNLESPVTYTLSVSRDGTGSGTVTSSPAGISCGSDCSESYASGTSVTLTASPAAGSTFAGWSGACTGTGTCTVTMSAARAVTATFNLETGVTYTLSVTKSGTGKGTVTSSPAGIDCGADCSEAYASGTVVTLTATPKWDSVFTGWSGACTGTGTCTVTMSAARAVAATFTSKWAGLNPSRPGLALQPGLTVHVTDSAVLFPRQPAMPLFKELRLF